MTFWDWMDHSFSRWKWYRRKRGGTWQRWYIDTPVGSCLWFRNPEWWSPDGTPGDRPGLGRGVPEVEHW